MAKLKSVEPALQPKFAKGDLVLLKSGGPQMTVDMVHTLRKQPPHAALDGIWDPDDRREIQDAEPIIGYDYTCQWFAGKKAEQKQFSEHVLQAAGPKP